MNNSGNAQKKNSSQKQFEFGSETFTEGVNAKGSKSQDSYTQEDNEAWTNTLESASSIYDRVQGQYTILKKLVSVEAKLNAKSILLILIASSCLGVLVVGCWISLLFALGFTLHSVGTPIILIVLVSLLAQIALMFIVYKLLAHLVSKIGFSHSLEALKCAVGGELSNSTIDNVQIN